MIWSDVLTYIKKRLHIYSFSQQYEQPMTPRSLLGSVFDVVQLSHVFADSKTFVDMVPKHQPKKISRAYLKQYGTQLDINRFVKDHFIPPVELPVPELVSENSPAPAQVREYIDRMWDVLTRDADKPRRYSSLLALPHRYVVPGGRFREIYYWDSYFTMLGLREAGKHDLLEEMVRNFAYLISQYGFIPNGNRTYYLTRSQPPVFALMVELLAQTKGSDVYNEFLPYIVKEYQYWMRGAKHPSFIKKNTDLKEHVVRMPGGEVLNRFFDTSISPREESFKEDLTIGRTLHESAEFYRNIRAGAESGWDYSTRWFEEGKGRESIRILDIVPVDLNVLLYMTEDLIARIYQQQGKPKLSEQYQKYADDRFEAIQKYVWHENDGWFYDYIISKQALDTRPTLAGVFPLFGGVATAQQAARIIERVESTFLRQGGLVTTLETSGEQWDAPNGWAPLQYIAVIGLERYGEHDLAQEIAVRWCALNISVFERTGRLLEKYNVEDVSELAEGGEYILQDGFGWTNGVLLTLMNKYHINRELPVDVLKEVL